MRSVVSIIKGRIDRYTFGINPSRLNKPDSRPLDHNKEIVDVLQASRAGPHKLS